MNLKILRHLTKKFWKSGEARAHYSEKPAVLFFISSRLDYCNTLFTELSKNTTGLVTLLPFYTDSRYVFGVAYDFGETWQKLRFLVPLVNLSNIVLNATTSRCYSISKKLSHC